MSTTEEELLAQKLLRQVLRPHLRQLLPILWRANIMGTQQLAHILDGAEDRMLQFRDEDYENNPAYRMGWDLADETRPADVAFFGRAPEVVAETAEIASPATMPQ